MASIKHDQSLEQLALLKSINPRFFASLYEGKPTPGDSGLFTSEMFNEVWDPNHYPKDLVVYTASDHATTTDKHNDPSCVGGMGMDPEGNWWVMPELRWGHFAPDVLVEKIIEIFRVYRPVKHTPENELIWKSIEPLLRAEMVKAHVETYCDPMVSTEALEARCAALLGKMALRKVYFPAFAPWYQQAKAEMLKFPYGRHDDFVSFLSLVTRNMPLYRTPSKPEEEPERAPGMTLRSLNEMENAGNVIPFEIVKRHA